MFCWRNYPVLVLIERKSHFIIIARLNGRLADETVQGLGCRCKPSETRWTSMQPSCSKAVLHFRPECAGTHEGLAL